MLNTASKTTFLAALVLTVGTLTGCGSADQPAANNAEVVEPEATVAAEAPAQAAIAAPAEAAPIDIATADAAAGKVTFDAKCSVCHSMVAGEGSMIGPHLDGVMDRKIASTSDFTYSPALSAHDGIWDAQTLSVFLKAPQKFAPGTRMGFAGIRDEAERANVIAYLATTK